MRGATSACFLQVLDRLNHPRSSSVTGSGRYIHDQVIRQSSKPLIRAEWTVTVCGPQIAPAWSWKASDCRTQLIQGIQSWRFLVWRSLIAMSRHRVNRELPSTMSNFCVMIENNDVPEWFLLPAIGFGALLRL